MKNVLLLVGVMFGGIMPSAICQTPQKAKFVRVPIDQVLITAAAQPDCPIEFDQLQYLEGVDGEGYSPGFTVRNRSNKPIKDFTVGGPDWTMSWSEKFTHKVLLPGERAFDGGSDIDIVELTDLLREKLKLKGPMKAVVVVMVVQVKYADGTVYDASQAYNALGAYYRAAIGSK